MKWFRNFSSNTLAGSGNQLFFCNEDHSVHIGRIYFQIYAGGMYYYSLLFSNIMDSTYADGTVSHCNLLCSEWEIVRAAIGVCKEVSEKKAGEVESLITLTFDGKRKKSVMPGEFFTSDPVKLKAQKGDYICFEVEYRGHMIPYHEESVVPVFVQKDEGWIPCKRVPFPGMIGCDRTVKAKIGFLGDSITQGIGTALNSYQHWNALIAENIGEQFAYWNLGIGFGRAEDAASDGAWLYKAKQMDAVVLCFGTNDIGQGKGAKQIQNDLLSIIQTLQTSGVKVLLHTLPPFDWTKDKLIVWLEVNQYLRSVLSEIADEFFDVVPILIDGKEESGKAKYGGHPNEEGSRIWANALLPVMERFMKPASDGLE